MNHYAVLGIDDTCSVEDIKNSYKRLAKLYHPNSTEGKSSPQKFIEIKASYDFLLSNHRPKVKEAPPKGKFDGENYFRVLDVHNVNGKYLANVFFDEDEFDMPTMLHMMWDQKEFTITLKAKTKIPNTIEVFNIAKDANLTLRLLRET